MFMRDDIVTLQRKTLPAFAPTTLKNDWRVLCEDIGERRAGTDAEQRAARFIAQSFSAAGMANVQTEAFPCTSLRAAKAEVHERNGRGWRRSKRQPWSEHRAHPMDVPSPVISSGWSCRKMPRGSARCFARSDRSRFLDPLPTSLVACIVGCWQPTHSRSFTSTIDCRFHGRRTTAYIPTGRARMACCRLSPCRIWTAGAGAVTAYEIKVRVAVNLVQAQSQNVIAEWPGRSPQLPAIALTAHHDTQCGNVGADDNASGVVCLLAFARALAGAKLQRTVRLISFGAEEQLSVGSFAYVRDHAITPARRRTRDQLRQCVFTARSLDHVRPGERCDCHATPCGTWRRAVSRLRRSPKSLRSPTSFRSTASACRRSGSCARISPAVAGNITVSMTRSKTSRSKKCADCSRPCIR